MLYEYVLLKRYTSFPAGIVQDDVTTTREDNIAMSFSGASSLTLGNVHEGDTRSATWTLRATTAGNRILSFRTWSENGGIDTVDVSISVSACYSLTRTHTGTRWRSDGQPGEFLRL